MPATHFCKTSDLLGKRLQTNPLYTGNHPLAEQVRNHVSGMVRAYCRREFDQNTYTVRFAVPTGGRTGTQRFWLKETPVTSITSIKCAQFLALATAQPLQPEFYYRLMDGATGEVAYQLDTTLRDLWFEVTYVGGYAAKGSPDTDILDVPQGLADAAALQGSYMLSRLSNHEMSQTVKRGKATTLSITSMGAIGWSAEAQVALAPFRRTLVGNLS